jgi:hypothetical protein
MAGMTKLLRKAIRTLRELPAQDQDALAGILLSMIEERAGDGTAELILDEETLSAMEEGLAQAELGGFAADIEDDDMVIDAVLEAPRLDLAERPMLALLPAPGGDGAAVAESRVLPLLRLVDQRGWAEQKSEVVAATPGLVFSAANWTASVTLDLGSSKAVADDS